MIDQFNSVVSQLKELRRLLIYLSSGYKGFSDLDFRDLNKVKILLDCMLPESYTRKENSIFIPDSSTIVYLVPMKIGTWYKGTFPNETIPSRMYQVFSLGPNQENKKEKI